MAQGSLFELGKVVTTFGAVEAIESCGHCPQAYIRRHEQGDWGVIGQYFQEQADAIKKQAKRIWQRMSKMARSNYESLTGERNTLLSEYHLPNGERIWIVTEHDLGQTTVMLPSEFGS